MSRITFKGWLKMELFRMSGAESLDLRILATRAQKSRPRLAAPLLLYAMETNVTERLLKSIYKKDLLREYKEVILLCHDKPIAELSLEEEEKLPWTYRKLLASWRTAKNRNESLTDSKRLRLERTRMLQKETGISNAQIYQTLDLNPGNVNAYLKHGDTSKVSLETATRIMKFLFSQEDEHRGKQAG